MTRRVLLVCLAGGLLLGGSVSVLAKGPCKSERVATYQCVRGDSVDGDPVGVGVVQLVDRRCVQENRKCRRQNTCQTVTLEVECNQGQTQPPNIVAVGVGCFCGGGSAPDRGNPVSVDEALEIIQALEAADVGDDGFCEAPAELETAID